VTPYAIFGIAMLSPVAVVLIAVALLRRRRGERVGWVRGTAAAVSAAFLITSTLLFTGWALPDDLDRLSERDQSSLGPALGSTPECGFLPFARVVSVEITAGGDGPPVLTYTCGFTPLGLPRMSGEARCVEGSWTGPGLRDMWSAGDCGRPPAP
jgi:hypothetical protein